MIKLMIVDDEFYEREAFKLMLTNECKDVEIVADFDNGLDAVNYCKNNDVDLIFMDIKMPLLNGIEATRQIKEFKPDQYIIILTAYADFEFAQQAVKIHADDFLLKPARLMTIQTSIKQFKEGAKKEDKAQANQEEVDYIKAFKHAFMKGHYLKCIECVDHMRQEEMYYDDLIIKVRLLLEIIRDVSTYFNVRLNIQRQKQIQHYLVSMKRKEEYFNLIDELLREVFSHIIEKKLGKYDQDVAMALDYIELNLTENVTLENVAGYMNISPHYFSKIFKRDIKVNFVQYVTGRKVEHAKRMLTMTNQSIINIAYDLGFNEANYFSRVFKKNVNMTPFQYRKQFKEVMK